MCQKYKNKNSHSGRVASQTSSTRHTRELRPDEKSSRVDTTHEPDFNIHYYLLLLLLSWL